MSAALRAVRAYPALLRVGFAGALAYRAEMIIWMLTTTMPLVSLALWSAVAEDGPIGRFDQRGFGAYFLATLVVRQLTGSWLVWELNQEIRSGSLSRRLLQPIHPLVAFSAENLAALPLRAIISAPITVGALVVAGEAHLPRSASLWAIWAASLLGAWLINFFTMAVIGSLAFFIDNSTAIFEIWLVAFMILSGYLVPVELFPPWLAALARALPFHYTIGFPVEVLTGYADEPAALGQLAVQAAYGVGSGALAVVMWRAGTRRFAAFGG